MKPGLAFPVASATSTTAVVVDGITVDAPKEFPRPGPNYRGHERTLREATTAKSVTASKKAPLRPTIVQSADRSTCMRQEQTDVNIEATMIGFSGKVVGGISLGIARLP